MINSANIILTHNCNLQCRHCYLDAKDCQEDYKRTYKDTKKLLTKLSKDGFEFVMFTGGECMIFPYLKELLLYAKEIGFKTAIFTNGMIYNQEIYDLVDIVNISLDGPKNIHNYIRKNENSFDNVIKVLDYLKKIDKVTNIQITISNENKDYLDFLPGFLINYLNVRKVNIEFVISSGRAAVNKIKHTKKDIKYVNEKIADFYEKTKYHIQFKLNVINRYDFDNYYLSGIITLPLWFDIPNSKYYILDEKLMKNSDLDNYSIDKLYEKNRRIIEALYVNRKKIIKNKYINIETISSDLFRGDL